jgi:SWI/SNF-related matrix-associated actin-dependent regulator 1 of chromatin subfamily A
MQLVKVGQRFVALSSYEERHIPKDAGFRWDAAAKRWWTDQPTKARALAGYASEELRAEIGGALAAAHTARVESVQASAARDSDAVLPCPEGRAYLPYQRAGIAFALARQNVLFGDDMGLGKTIQAIGTISADESVEQVLIICPASLKLNWARELGRWLTRPLSVGIASGDYWPATQVVIVNYDIVSRHIERIHARAWDMLICDEVHALKNAKAQRTRAILGGKGAQAIAARRRLFLTGTPILNRPSELWTLVQSLDPSGLGGNFFRFHKQYCNAYKTRYGWDFSGASNLDELQRRLRETIMIRRLKADVLTDLPAKRRQVVELAANGCGEIIGAERSAYEANAEAIERLRAEADLADAREDKAAYEAAVMALKAAQGVLFSQMSKLRHATAVAKIPYVLEHVREAVEASGKVIVFAWHADVIDAIAKEFGQAAVTVTGQTAIEKRQAAVDRFQTDPTCTLFVGNILAAGVGLTLTAASHVIFAELDWRPAMITQAEDRAHRIGQRESVLVQHIVFDGSLDATMAQRIVEKQAIIDAALDRGMAPPEEEDTSLPDIVAQVAPEELSPRAPEQATAPRPVALPAMTGEQIEAVHEALRALAGMDTDRAAVRNDMGFNRYDGTIGHSLAQAERLTVKQAVLGRRIARKYVRQLGRQAVEAMGAVS